MSDDDDNNDDPPAWRSPSEDEHEREEAERGRRQSRRDFFRNSLFLATAVGASFSGIRCNSAPRKPELHSMLNAGTNVYTRRPEKILTLDLKGADAENVSRICITPKDVSVYFNDGTIQHIELNSTPNFADSKVLLKLDSATLKRDFDVIVENPGAGMNLTVYCDGSNVVCPGCFNVDVANAKGPTTLAGGSTARLRVSGMKPEVAAHALSAEAQEYAGDMPLGDDRLHAHSRITHASKVMKLVMPPTAGRDMLQVKNRGEFEPVPMPEGPMPVVMPRRLDVRFPRDQQDPFGRFGRGTGR